jgi:hypothetical protein
VWIISGYLAGCSPTSPPLVEPRPPAPAPQPGPALGGTEQPKPPEAKGAEFRKILGSRAQRLKDAELFRRKLVIGFGFEDDSNSCVTPPPIDEAAIDIDKSLIVHDVETMGDSTGPFKLRRTLDQIATQAGIAGVTGETVYRDLWDTQNPKPGAGGPLHCDDVASPVPGPGLGGLNGYPVHCRNADGSQANTAATDLDKYRPIALVNRLDLAHEGWRNCGEHRIVYGRTDSSTLHRNFIIFEAVLPNPKPGCRSACKPVMEFWAGLSSSTVNTAQRQAKLATFFYGSPPPAGSPPGTPQVPFFAGFQPVVHLDHYTAKGVGSTYGSSGSGQIRTNQFFQQPWLLKEFHLLLDCGSPPCAFSVVPTMIKVNPFGELWNATLPTSSPFAGRANAFQADLLSGSPTAVQALASATFDGIGYGVDLEFDAAEANSQFGAAPDNYRVVFNAGAGSAFNADFASAATAAGKTADQLVNRAVALSCAGCHQPSAFGLTAANSIGSATLVGGGARDSWPNSLPSGFVHVGETAAGGVFPLSPALTDVFLPSRKANLVSQLQQDTCACSQKFLSLPPNQRAKALEIQERLKLRFKPDIDNVRIKVPKPGPRPLTSGEGLTSRGRIITGVGDVQRKLDTELLKELQRENIQVPQLIPDQKVQPDLLDAGQRSGGDQAKARLLRHQAVIEQVKKEPPRRTVTGSFRVH